MSETETTSVGPSGAADGTATAAPTTGAEAGTSVAAPAATAKERIERAKAGAEGAIARASARKAGEPADTNSSAVTKAAEKAAGGDLPAGGAAASGADDGGTATAGAPGADNAPSGSTVTAPDDWPEDYKARFAALPNDEARTMLLDTYKGMQRAFTESTAEVARVRKDHEDLIKTVETHGMDAAEAARVLKLSASFAENPRQVLQQLAAQAGVEVFFERPVAKGEMPEFKDAAEMAEWVRQEALERLREETKAEEARVAEERERETHRNRMREELATVRKTYGENFTKAQTAVMERLLAPLSIEDAYHLVNLPTLRQQAEEGTRAKADFAAARAELEATRKRATQPPAGVNGTGHQSVDDARLSPAERSVRRAEARKAAAANAGA